VKNWVNQTVSWYKERVNEVDIAWLAGIMDGEGCFSVKRPIVRKSGKARGKMTSYQLWVVICNTSKAMIDRVSRILTDVGVHHQPIRRVWKGQKATRWQYWLHVAKKDDVLKITRILLPHLTAKKTEAEVVEWFLNRACQVKMYRQTKLDAVVLETMSVIKRNGGEAPAEVEAILREVIPSQATGGHRMADVLVEGVETRSVSSNNNPTQERPASQRPLN